MQYEEFLNRILGEATKIAMRHYGSVSSSVKQEDNNQVLTQADIEIGRFLVEECRKQYPTYNCIDEEAGVIDNGSEYTWVIDPIDGTSNFANGLPHFGVMIGLLQADEPIAGGIALPALGDVYIAEKGRGAYKNGQPLNVSTEKKLQNSLVAYGIDGHQEQPELTQHEMTTLSSIVLAIRNLRSSNSAFDMCAVADGRYGLFLNQTTKIWDNVAPQVIIEEAGGVYSDFSGKTIDYRDALERVNENFTVCAGAKELHEQIQSVMRAQS